MAKTSTPKVTVSPRIIALRGFYVEGQNTAPITGMRDGQNGLLISQNGKTIYVPEYLINAFQRAVADIDDVPDMTLVKKDT